MMEIEVVLTDMLLPACLLVLLMFLPSIIELKKPRDAGPRLIHKNLKTGSVSSNSSISVETGLVSGQLTIKGSIFPEFIYDIEA